MDFNFTIAKVVHLNEEGYGIIDKNHLYST